METSRLSEILTNGIPLKFPDCQIEMKEGYKHGMLNVIGVRLQVAVKSEVILKRIKQLLQGQKFQHEHGSENFPSGGVLYTIGSDQAYCRMNIVISMEGTGFTIAMINPPEVLGREHQEPVTIPMRKIV